MKINPALIHTSLALYLLLIFIMSSIPGEELPQMGFEFSDKLIHAAVYFVLLFLFFYSLKYQSKSVKLRRNALLFAGLFTVIYGLTDEIHQYFVPMRSCEFADFLADVAGALAGMLTLRAGYRKLMLTPLLLASFVTGSCNSSDKMHKGAVNKPEVSIISEEAWTDHMPVIDERGPKLGFQIMLEPKSGKDDIRVMQLRISRSGGEFEVKPFEVVPQEVTDGRKRIAVIQARDMKYFDTAVEDNEEIQFEITLIYGKGNKSILTTKKIKPYKVY